MTSSTMNDFLSDDDSSCEEPTTFPYLLTLDNDTELLEDEQMETMAHEEEPEKLPASPMAAQTLCTTRKTTELPRANPTTTPAAAATTNESAHLMDETLGTMHTRLADAQAEIINLRHRVEQNDLRILEYEQRMTIMENILTQVVRCSTPAESSTEAKVQDSKRKWEGNSDNNQGHQQAKRPKTVKAYVTRPKEKKGYGGNRPYCSKCTRHHKGSCGVPCRKCKQFGHQAKSCRVPTTVANPDAPRVCFKCGDTRHFKNECPELKDRNHNNNQQKTP